MITLIDTFFMFFLNIIIVSLANIIWSPLVATQVIPFWYFFCIRNKLRKVVKNKPNDYKSTLSKSCSNQILIKNDQIQSTKQLINLLVNNTVLENIRRCFVFLVNGFFDSLKPLDLYATVGQFQICWTLSVIRNNLRIRVTTKIKMIMFSSLQESKLQ